MSLAFLPLDIEVPKVDFDALEHHVHTYSVANIQKNLGMDITIPSKYTFDLTVAYAKGNEYDLENINMTYYQSFCRRTDLSEPSTWFFDFNNKFPELTKLVESLPIDIGHMELLKNKASVFAHCDEWEVDGKVDPIWHPFWPRTEEQKRSVIDADLNLGLIKVFLYENEDHKYQSFFMQKDMMSDPVYCYGPGSCFVAGLSKTKYLHGADMIPDDGSRKIVFNIHGIIKRDEYKKLVDKSMDKYGDYACQF
jgi:hypothetical protein